MATWELARDAASAISSPTTKWLRLRDIVQAALERDPNANVGTIRNQVRFHCINDRTRVYNPGRTYRTNPLFVTDEPNAYGKLFRVLTPEERAAYLTNPRDDLDEISYAELEDWLKNPKDAAPKADQDEPDGPDDVVGGPALLELHLQDYLFRNWASCFPNLTLFNAKEGREYQTSDPGVGTLDFLCTDESGNWVVIETKRWSGERKAIGQLLSYMGWVQQRLCRPGQTVKGILVISEANDALRMAASAVPNLELRQYEIAFKLTPVTD